MVIRVSYQTCTLPLRVRAVPIEAMLTDVPRLAGGTVVPFLQDVPGLPITK